MKKDKIVVLSSSQGHLFRILAESVETGELDVKIVCLVTDRRCNAPQVARRYGISTYVVDHKNEQQLNDKIMAMIFNEADLIVCAGYLSMIRPPLIKIFRNKIINTHLSLLPKHRGIGMQGLHIQRTVIEEGQEETGCTVHYVDETLSGGEIIAQRAIPVSPLDDLHSLRAKVLRLGGQLQVDTIRELFSEGVVAGSE